MTGFDWDEIFIWALSWFTSLTFSWTNSLTDTPGGTSGGMVFLNIFDRFRNASLCLYSSLISGLAGAGLCSA